MEIGSLLSMSADSNNTVPYRADLSNLSNPDPMDKPGINPAFGIDEGDFDYLTYVEDLDGLRQVWTSDRAFWPTTLVYSLAFILGIIGNSVVVFALLVDKKAHNVTNSFLVSLATADLLFLLVCIPYETAARWSGYLAEGSFLCKLAGFVEMLSEAASIWNLTIVSIERYIVIVHPMRSRTLCTLGRTKKMIVIVWFAAALMSVPYSYVLDTRDYLWYNNDTYTRESFCSDINFHSDRDRVLFAWYQLLVMFAIPSCIMAYCYAVVIRVLWLSTQQLANMTGSGPKYGRKGENSQALHSHTSKRHDDMTSQSENTSSAVKKPLKFGRINTDQSHEMKEARKQVIKMLLTIIVIFMLCWGPRFILNVLKRHEGAGRLLHTPIAWYILLVINLLPYLQSATNPVIYSFMSNNFRRSMRAALLRCHCCTCCIHGDTPRDRTRMPLTAINKNYYTAISTSGYTSGHTVSFAME